MACWAMRQHTVDPEGLPYSPSKLARKPDVSFGDFACLDVRTGVVTTVETFPQMRKPSYKLQVDFGPVVGRLWTSAQITNYPKDA